jgi:hypothetical protein
MYRIPIFIGAVTLAAWFGWTLSNHQTAALLICGFLGVLVGGFLAAGLEESTPGYLLLLRGMFLIGGVCTIFAGPCILFKLEGDTAGVVGLAAAVVGLFMSFRLKAISEGA